MDRDRERGMRRVLERKPASPSLAWQAWPIDSCPADGKKAGGAFSALVEHVLASTANADHRQNMMSAQNTHVGIGVSGGLLLIMRVFLISAAD
jgi:hypothetical protein